MLTLTHAHTFRLVLTLGGGAVAAICIGFKSMYIVWQHTTNAKSKEPKRKRAHKHKITASAA